MKICSHDQILPPQVTVEDRWFKNFGFELQQLDNQQEIEDVPFEYSKRG